MPELCQICHAPLDQDDAFGTCSHCLSSVLTGESEEEPLLPEEARNNTTDHVADYEILEVIGSGGMASVYRARHRPLDRIVALKVAHPGPAMGQAVLERFRVEAETVAALSHPNVVQIFGSGVQDGRPYVAMEFVAGGTLAEHFARFSPANPNLSTAEFKARLERAIWLMLKITRGVQHAHERAILHRDIKPSNVLLDADDEPKVADFGLAKRLGEGRDLTLTNAVMGTPDYMAPEIASSGARNASSACDIYSLGAMLYHLLTNAPPFQGDTTLETIRRAADEEARPPSVVNLRVPKDLTVICMKCLAKEPARRYHSAGDLADDLERYLTHQPIVARPATPAEKFMLWCRRHPRRAAGLAALALSLVAGTTGITWQWWQTLKSNRALAQSEAHLSQELQMATALRLASQARNALEESPPRALLLAAMSAKNAQGSKARSAAYAALIETLNEVGGMPILGGCSKSAHAAISPNGKWFARLEEDGQAALQHLEKTSAGNHWAAHAKEGSGLGWLDDQMLCTAGIDGRVSLWKIETNAQTTLAGFVDIGEALVKMAVLPNEKQTVTLGKSGALRLWPIKDTGFGESRFIGEFSDPAGLEVDASGRQFAVIHHRTATLLTFDPKTGEVRQRLVKRSPGHVKFSPDGNWLGTGGADNKSYLFNVADTQTNFTKIQTGQLTGDVNALAFSPDGQWVACVGNGEMMMLWKIGQSTAVPPIPIRIGGYRNYAVAFSKDSGTIYTGGADHQIHAFNLGALASAPSESLLRGFETAVREILISLDGEKLVGIGGDGSVRMWNLNHPSGAAFSASPKLPGNVRDLHYTPDGAWLAAACNDRNLYGWRCNHEMNPGFVLSGHRAEVCVLAFGPDGRWLVSGSYDGTVRLWDWQARVEGRTNFTDRVLLTLPDAYQVRGVVVHPKDGRIIAAGGGGYLRIVRTNASAPPLAWQTTNSADLRTMAISHDERWLAVGGIARTPASGTVVEIRDLNTPDAVLVRTVFTRGTVETIAFSMDDRYLASGGSDRVVSLWDLADSRTNAQPRLAPFSTGAIGELEFSPDGQTLVIGSWDSTVRLWQFLDQAAETPTFRQVLGVRACAVSPDGRQLAGGGYGSQVTVWNLDEDELLRLAYQIAGRELTPEERMRFGNGVTPK